jgi:sterol 3beta-glucosyltransferase
VEEVHLLGSSDTLKISVMDNDETYAIDEYYFLFFSRTQEAFLKLQTCLNNAKPKEQVSERCRTVSGESTKFKDSVKDTTTFIHAGSPPSNNFEGSARQSSESVRGDIMDDAEYLTSGQNSPRRRSCRMSRDSVRHFSLGSLSGRRSPSPSPLRTSFDGYDRKSPRSGFATPTSQTEEPSWTGTGKMLWSRGADAVGWVKERSAAVGTLLASPSTTLSAGVGKVSQFWSGDSGNSEHARWISEETAKDMKDQNPEERFQTHFALPPSENLLGSHYGYVFRTFPFYGKMYISQKYFCFRSLLPGFKTKVS